MGIIIALNPFAGLACCLTWVVTALIFRISSLSALVAAVLSPLYSYIFSDLRLAILAGILCILILLKHTENIKRLVSGTEPKIGNK